MVMKEHAEKVRRNSTSQSSHRARLCRRSVSAAEKNEPQTKICLNLLKSKAQNLKLFSTELTASQDKAKNVY